MVKRNKKKVLKREEFHSSISNTWDITIIGGGATGLGIALDAAARGYKTLLLEQADFAKGTSSRSTKLVHGGVRYLAQGNISLVRHALKERGLLLKNAPHLVKKQPFIIPCYSWFSVLKYLCGLKIYDWMAGGYSFGKSEFLTKEQVIKAIPTINSEILLGGIQYFDGQIDDARLAVNIAQSAAEQGAVLINYTTVIALSKDDHGNITGLSARDLETDQTYQIRSKAVINATGVFVDSILKMDTPNGKQLVRPSQGVHVVLDKSFLDGSTALMIPETSDGRVLFGVPWHDFILVGTTDTPLDESSLEPRALEKEIDFILETAGNYLKRKPTRNDILSIFAGLRPLAAPDKDAGSTKEISRDHKLIVSASGLITITGGKWTTYRQMAEETVNQAIKTAGLAPVSCKTRDLKIHGFAEITDADHLAVYGSDAREIKMLIEQNPELGSKLDADLPYLKAEVIWAVRNEMARKVEDVLARRLRILFLNAKAAIRMAPEVAALMAKELEYSADWEASQVREFTELAGRYLPVSNISTAELLAH